MPGGGWVTVDKSSDKKQREKERKQRKRDEALEEQMQLQSAVGAQYSLVGAPVAPSARVNRLAAAQRGPTAAEEAATQRQQEKLEAQRQKEEDARAARRRVAAERAKAKCDVNQWPLTASVIEEGNQTFSTATTKALENVAGAECSYVRALYAMNTLESMLRHTLLFGDGPCSRGDMPKELLPLMAIEDNANAERVLNQFGAKFLRFGSDGDAHTMFNLITSVYGSRGSRQEEASAIAQGMGSRLGLQLLIKHNLPTMLAASGMITDAFTAVEGSGMFHTPASASNFFTLARTTIWCMQQCVVHHTDRESPALPFTLLDARNGCISLFRALSNDKCGRCTSDAAELLAAMSDVLESLLDLLELPPKKSKPQFFPLLAEDITFLLDFAARGHITPSVANVLLMELGVDHHPDFARTCFPTMISLLQGILSSGSGSTELIDSLCDIMSQITVERGADVFPAWGDCFAKTPLASSMVLTKAAQDGATVDKSFVEKVQKRLSKLQHAASQPDVDGALAAVQNAVKRGTVADVVGAVRKKGEVPVSRGARRQAVKVEGGDSRKSVCASWCWTSAKIAVVVGVVCGLFASGHV